MEIRPLIRRVYGATATAAFIETYSNKLTREHDRLALHAVLRAAEFSFSENDRFQPLLNPLRILMLLGKLILMLLGKLTLQHLRILLLSFDTELVRNRDGGGRLPIHIACLDGAPVEVLDLIAELDPSTLQIADHSGALPVHSLCCRPTAKYASVRLLVEQGGPVLWPLATTKEHCHYMFCVDLPIHRCEPFNIWYNPSLDRWRH
jgi:hypothetical protein